MNGHVTIPLPPPGAIPVPCRKPGHTSRMKRQDTTSHFRTNCIPLPRQQRTQRTHSTHCHPVTHIHGHGVPNSSQSHTCQYMPIFGKWGGCKLQDRAGLSSSDRKCIQEVANTSMAASVRMEWWLPQWFTHKIVRTLHTDKIEISLNESNINLHTYTWNAKEFILFSISSLCSQFRAPPVSACTYTVRHFT